MLPCFKQGSPPATNTWMQLHACTFSQTPMHPSHADSCSAAGGRPALIPPGTSPHVVAALLKRFLLGEFLRAMQNLHEYL